MKKATLRKAAFSLSRVLACVLCLLSIVLALVAVSGPLGTKSLAQGAGSAGVGCNCAPPDTNGAVGQTQYVQIVNEGYQVFDKATGSSVLGLTAFLPSGAALEVSAKAAERVIQLCSMIIWLTAG